MDLVLEANQRIPLGFLQKASDHIHCGCHSGWDAVLCIDDPVLSVVNTHPEKPKVANPYTDSFAAQLAARGTNMRKVERALSTGGSSPITTQGTSSTKGIVPGATVKHNRFGVGVIKSIEGSGENAKAVVDFRNEGTRQLLLKFAKLEVL